MAIAIASPITPGSSGYSAAPTTPGSVVILLQFQQAIPGPNFLLLPDLESEKPLPLRHLPRHQIGGNSGLLTNFGSVEKLTSGRLKSAIILKTRPKQVFLAIKVPKIRCVIFCPPPFYPTFLREIMWVLARCAGVIGAAE